MTALLRAALVAALAALVAWPPGPDPAPGEPVRRAHFAAADLARVLAGAPPALVREGPAPPDGAELGRLAAAAERAPLYAALPAGGTRVGVDPPARMRLHRRAGLGVRVLGAPGDSGWIRLRDEVGVADSARVGLDAAGQGRGAFRVLPRTAGWQQWTVEWNGEQAVAGAWADSAPAVRVLVHAGPPGWESRFVVRALEESGAAVAVRYDLGRGLSVGAGAQGLSAADLRGAEVALVMDGAPLSAPQARMLAAWAEGGGGVLLAGDRAGTPGFGLGTAGAALPTPGTALDWRLPPELQPLPAIRTASALYPLGSPPAGARSHAAAPRGGVLSLRPLGSGRVAALGLGETWRWRMEGGAVAEHREFWRSLVDHLAATGPVEVSVRPRAPAVGQPVEVVRWGVGSPGESLAVVGPSGAEYALEVHGEEGPGTARFVPPAAGVYRVVTETGRTVAAFRADTARAEDAWAALALLAWRSGGQAVPAESLSAALGEVPRGAPRRPHRAAWMLAIVLLAGAEWALRRLRGRP